MKLIRAKFSNFRLLKDVELDFSNDEAKRLTVIRAANETGKTTTLTALIWALYGSKAINKKNGYHSATALDNKGCGEIEIEVEVEFLTEEVQDNKGKSILVQKHYKLIRKCTEVVKNNSFNRIREVKSLFLVKTTGDDRIIDSEVDGIIEKSLPKNLKDIYFTDGDSAMSFIEASADERVKRKRVQLAIESLLSMDVVKDLISKLEKVRANYGRSIQKDDLGGELSRLNEQRDNIVDFLNDEEEEIFEFSQQKTDLTITLKKVKEHIEDTLKLGDREKLLNNIKNQRTELIRLKSLQASSKLRLAEILGRNEVASFLLKDNVAPAIGILENLRKNKQLPKQSIPVLAELLELDQCFCGSDLSLGTSEGKRKRAFIEEKIKLSEESDKLNAIATELFYALKSDPIQKNTTKNWLVEYETSMADEANIAKQIQETEKSLEQLELDVSKIKDDFLQNLKAQERLLQSKINSLISEISSREYECTRKKDALNSIKSDIESIAKKLDKKDNSSGKYKLADDLNSIFSNIFGKIKTDELQKVSLEMNRIFLAMIGSDPVANPNTMIQSAALTNMFDIKVFGINGHELDPDQDLNGASRRAITLAFILALTKVSKVDAVNIIDTPLGMMSGFVKRSVLKNLISESKQVILFLTHSEIAGVEDIIDEFGGKVFTLTNPGHYPLQLVNKPPVEESAIIRCECSHREVCGLCERKNGETA
ncbi:AAA family ATPase [Shewanella sp. MEBiC00475]|uniref:AAA family ATPase n=1 Tax=Shewanella sp. MEBiC00475 TaxID=2575361 RepID=UPI0010C0E269|nr:AAA family ATPase [Shewanella sp. MEBiC00475]